MAQRTTVIGGMFGWSLADDVAWGDAFFRSDEAKAAIVCACHQDHALALNSAQFAWREVDEERDLAAHHVFGGEVLGDAADDSPCIEPCIDGELQKLVSLGDFFAGEDGADAKVEFGEVVEGDFVFGRHEIAV